MQVVDLRSSARRTPPELELWPSPAAELVRIVVAFSQDSCGGFDVPAERLEALRDELGPQLRARLDAENTDVFFHLIASVTQLPAPGTVEALLAALDGDALAWRTTTVQALQSVPGVDGDGLAVAVTEGEDAVRALLVGAERPLEPWVDELLAEDPVAFGTRMAGLLRDIHASVGERMLAEAAGPIAREVEARRGQLAAGRPVNELVIEATNGYDPGTELPIDRVLLLPTYWFRPWIIIGRVGRTEVLTSLVADEHLSLPSAAPPPSLVKLCKALGDEGRLRLLRRMGGGPISLADAMDELDVAKTTAHHHLSILRQAGLVVIRGEGRDTEYGLRTEPPAAAATALEEYLGSTAVLCADGSSATHAG